MQASDKIIKFIAKREGFVAKAMRPLPNDRWTVGYGSTFIDGRPVGPNDTMTQEQAMEQLKKNVEAIALPLSHLCPPGITQNQFDAIVSLCYNIGLQRFIVSVTGKKFIAGSNVSDRLPMFNKSNGVEIAGLTKRRLAEKLIYDARDYGNVG